MKRMRFACWKTKASNAGSDYIILIASPREKMATRTRQNFTFKCTLLALLSETAVSTWTTFSDLAKKKKLRT